MLVLLLCLMYWKPATRSIHCESLCTSIRNLYRKETAIATKTLEKLRSKKRKLRSQLTFLLRFIDDKIIPTSLGVTYHNKNIIISKKNTTEGRKRSGQSRYKKAARPLRQTSTSTSKTWRQTRSRELPVSYTHLDVYKRQTLQCRAVCK